MTDEDDCPWDEEWVPKPGTIEVHRVGTQFHKHRIVRVRFGGEMTLPVVYAECLSRPGRC